MNPVSIAMLAKLFKVSGTVLGVPSVAVLMVWTVLMCRRHLAGDVPKTYFGENPDAILLILQGMTRVVGAIASFMGSIAQVVLDLAAAVSGACLVFAIVLWFTGRGLQAHATWARVSGFALLTLALFVALVLALSLRGGGRIAGLALAAFVVLGLHALWTGAHHIIRV